MKTREILRNFGIALLGWVLSGAGAFLAFWLQFFGSEKTDSCDSSGLLLSWYWDVNLLFYGLGAVLSLVCFTVFWRLMLRRTLLNLLPLKKSGCCSGFCWDCLRCLFILCCSFSA